VQSKGKRVKHRGLLPCLLASAAKEQSKGKSILFFNFFILILNFYYLSTLYSFILLPADFFFCLCLLPLLCKGKAQVKRSSCNWSKINLFTAFVFIFYAQSNIQVDLVDLLLKCIYLYHFNGIYYI
jgi:hypothetical protein